MPVEQLDETSRQYSIDSTAAQSALQRADTATIREGDRVWLERMVRERGRDMKCILEDQLTKAVDNPVAQLLSAILAAVRDLLEMEAADNSSSSSSTGNNSTGDSSGISTLTTEPTLPSAMPVQDYGMPWLIYQPMKQNEIYNLLAFGYKGPYTTGLPVTVETTVFSRPCVC
jgi:hypothetical protein